MSPVALIPPGMPGIKALATPTPVMIRAIALRTTIILLTIPNPPFIRPHQSCGWGAEFGIIDK
jgi:hypothetical protein